MNSTKILFKSKVNHLGNSYCEKDDLTDMFGWFLQGLLACLAFTCLIGKIIRKISIQLDFIKFYFNFKL